jgi:hypothetical protein
MKDRMWLSVLFACFLCSTRCYADDRLMLDLYTKHSSDCQYAYAKTCEPWQQPRRMSWQHDFTESLSSDIGMGSNSYGNASVSLGAAWKPIHVAGIRAGVWGSYVTGYTCAQLKTCNVVGGAIASFYAGKIAIDLMYVPAIGDGTVSVTQIRGGIAF